LACFLRLTLIDYSTAVTLHFLEKGEVMVSPRVNRDDLRRLGFEQLAFERFGICRGS